MPEEVIGGFSEVTFEHGLSGFVDVLRRLRRERVYQKKALTNQHTYRVGENKRPFRRSEEVSWLCESTACGAEWMGWEGVMRSYGWPVKALAGYANNCRFYPLDLHCLI